MRLIATCCLILAAAFFGHWDGRLVQQQHDQRCLERNTTTAWIEAATCIGGLP